jgi:hypothetical protein
VQKLIRAVGRRRARIEIGPTGYAAHEIKLTTEDTEEDTIISSDNKSLDPVLQVQRVEIDQQTDWFAA